MADDKNTTPGRDPSNSEKGKTPGRAVPQSNQQIVQSAIRARQAKEFTMPQSEYGISIQQSEYETEGVRNYGPDLRTRFIENEAPLTQTNVALAKFENQGTMSKLMYGIARLPGKIAMGVGEQVSYGLDPRNWMSLIDLSFDVHDNKASRFFKGAGDAIGEAMPSYTNPEDEWDWDSPSFWINTLSEGVESVAEFIVAGELGVMAGIGKIGAATQAAKLDKIRKGINTMKSVTQVEKAIKGLNKSQRAFDRVNRWGRVLETGVSASVLNGIGTKHSVEMMLRGQINPETGRPYNEKEINKISGASAAITYQNALFGNIVLNGTLNLAMTKITPKLPKNAVRQGKETTKEYLGRMKELMKDPAKWETSKLGFLRLDHMRKYLNRNAERIAQSSNKIAKVAGKIGQAATSKTGGSMLFEIAQEAAEEYWEGVSQMYGENYAKEKMYKRQQDVDYLSEELVGAAIIGGILGGGTSLFMGAVKKNKEADSEVAVEEMFQHKIAALERRLELQTTLEGALQRGDVEAAKAAEDELFVESMINIIDSEEAEDYMAQMQEIENMSKEEAEEKGYLRSQQGDYGASAFKDYRAIAKASREALMKARADYKNILNDSSIPDDFKLEVAKQRFRERLLGERVKVMEEQLNEHQASRGNESSSNVVREFKAQAIALQREIFAEELDGLNLDEEQRKKEMKKFEERLDQKTDEEYAEMFEEFGKRQAEIDALKSVLSEKFGSLGDAASNKEIQNEIDEKQKELNARMASFLGGQQSSIDTAEKMGESKLRGTHYYEDKVSYEQLHREKAKYEASARQGLLYNEEGYYDTVIAMRESHEEITKAKNKLQKKMEARTINVINGGDPTQAESDITEIEESIKALEEKIIKQMEATGIDLPGFNTFEELQNQMYGAALMGMFGSYQSVEMLEKALKDADSALNPDDEAYVDNEEGTEGNKRIFKETTDNGTVRKYILDKNGGKRYLDNIVEKMNNFYQQFAQSYLVDLFSNDGQVEQRKSNKALFNHAKQFMKDYRSGELEKKREENERYLEEFINKYYSKDTDQDITELLKTGRGGSGFLSRVLSQENLGRLSINGLYGFSSYEALIDYYANSFRHTDTVMPEQRLQIADIDAFVRELEEGYTEARDAEEKYLTKMLEIFSKRNKEFARFVADYIKNHNYELAQRLKNTSDSSEQFKKEELNTKNVFEHLTKTGLFQARSKEARAKIGGSPLNRIDVFNDVNDIKLKNELREMFNAPVQQERAVKNLISFLIKSSNKVNAAFTGRTIEEVFANDEMMQDQLERTGATPHIEVMYNGQTGAIRLRKRGPKEKERQGGLGYSTKAQSSKIAQIFQENNDAKAAQFLGAVNSLVEKSEDRKSQAESVLTILNDIAEDEPALIKRVATILKTDNNGLSETETFTEFIETLIYNGNKEKLETIANLFIEEANNIELNDPQSVMGVEMMIDKIIELQETSLEKAQMNVLMELESILDKGGDALEQLKQSYLFNEELIKTFESATGQTFTLEGKSLGEQTMLLNQLAQMVVSSVVEQNNTDDVSRVAEYFSRLRKAAIEEQQEANGKEETEGELFYEFIPIETDADGNRVFTQDESKMEKVDKSKQLNMDDMYVTHDNSFSHFQLNYTEEGQISLRLGNNQITLSPAGIFGMLNTLKDSATSDELRLPAFAVDGTPTIYTVKNKVLKKELEGQLLSYLMAVENILGEPQTSTIRQTTIQTKGGPVKIELDLSNGIENMQVKRVWEGNPEKETIYIENAEQFMNEGVTGENSMAIYNGVIEIIGNLNKEIKNILNIRNHAANTSSNATTTNNDGTDAGQGQRTADEQAAFEARKKSYQDLVKEIREQSKQNKTERTAEVELRQLGEYALYLDHRREAALSLHGQNRLSEANAIAAEIKALHKQFYLSPYTERVTKELLESDYLTDDVKEQLKEMLAYIEKAYKILQDLQYNKPDEKEIEQEEQEEQGKQEEDKNEDGSKEESEEEQEEGLTLEEESALEAGAPKRTANQKKHYDEGQYTPPQDNEATPFTEIIENATENSDLNKALERNDWPLSLAFITHFTKEVVNGKERPIPNISVGSNKKGELIIEAISKNGSWEYLKNRAVSLPGNPTMNSDTHYIEFALGRNTKWWKEHKAKMGNDRSKYYEQIPIYMIARNKKNPDEDYAVLGVVQTSKGMSGEKAKANDKLRLAIYNHLEHAGKRVVASFDKAFNMNTVRDGMSTNNVLNVFHQLSAPDEKGSTAKHLFFPVSGNSDETTRGVNSLDSIWHLENGKPSNRPQRENIVFGITTGLKAGRNIPGTELNSDGIGVSFDNLLDSNLSKADQDMLQKELNEHFKNIQEEYGQVGNFTEGQVFTYTLDPEGKVRLVPLSTANITESAYQDFLLNPLSTLDRNGVTIEEYEKVKALIEQVIPASQQYRPNSPETFFELDFIPQKEGGKGNVVMRYYSKEKDAVVMVPVTDGQGSLSGLGSLLSNFERKGLEANDYLVPAIVQKYDEESGNFTNKGGAMQIKLSTMKEMMTTKKKMQINRDLINTSAPFVLKKPVTGTTETYVNYNAFISGMETVSGDQNYFRRMAEVENNPTTSSMLRHNYLVTGNTIYTNTAIIPKELKFTESPYSKKTKKEGNEEPEFITVEKRVAKSGSSGAVVAVEENFPAISNLLGSKDYSNSAYEAMLNDFKGELKSFVYSKENPAYHILLKGITESLDAVLNNSPDMSANVSGTKFMKSALDKIVFDTTVLFDRYSTKEALDDAFIDHPKIKAYSFSVSGKDKFKQDFLDVKYDKDKESFVITVKDQKKFDEAYPEGSVKRFLFGEVVSFYLQSHNIQFKPNGKVEKKRLGNEIVTMKNQSNSPYIKNGIEFIINGKSYSKDNPLEIKKDFSKPGELGHGGEVEYEIVKEKVKNPNYKGPIEEVQNKTEDDLEKGESGSNFTGEDGVLEGDEEPYQETMTKENAPNKVMNKLLKKYPLNKEGSFEKIKSIIDKAYNSTKPIADAVNNNTFINALKRVTGGDMKAFHERLLEKYSEIKSAYENDNSLEVQDNIPKWTKNDPEFWKVAIAAKEGAQQIIVPSAVMSNGSNQVVYTVTNKNLLKKLGYDASVKKAKIRLTPISSNGTRLDLERSEVFSKTTVDELESKLFEISNSLEHENGDSNSSYYIGTDAAGNKKRYLRVSEALKGNMSDVTASMQIAFNYGNAVDTIARDIFDGKEINTQELMTKPVPDTVSINEKTGLEQEALYGELLTEEAIEELKTYFGNMRSQMLKRGERIIAKDLRVKLDGAKVGVKGNLPIAGTVDLITIGKDGKVHLYDFKTMRKWPSEKDYQNNKINDWSRQLHAYAEAIYDEIGIYPSTTNIISAELKYKSVNKKKKSEALKNIEPIEGSNLVFENRDLGKAVQSQKISGISGKAKNKTSLNKEVWKKRTSSRHQEGFTLASVQTVNDTPLEKDFTINEDFGPIEVAENSNSSNRVSLVNKQNTKIDEGVFAQKKESNPGEKIAYSYVTQSEGTGFNAVRSFDITMQADTTENSGQLVSSKETFLSDNEIGYLSKLIQLYNNNKGNIKSILDAKQLINNIIAKADAQNGIMLAIQESPLSQDEFVDKLADTLYNRRGDSERVTASRFQSTLSISGDKYSVMLQGYSIALVVDKNGNIKGFRSTNIEKPDTTHDILTTTENATLTSFLSQSKNGETINADFTNVKDGDKVAVIAVSNLEQLKQLLTIKEAFARKVIAAGVDANSSPALFPATAMTMIVAQHNPSKKESSIPNEGATTVTDEIYKHFLDTEEVPNSILEMIAKKYMDTSRTVEPTLQEKTIYSAKSADIEAIMRKLAEEDGEVEVEETEAERLIRENEERQREENDNESGEEVELDSIFDENNPITGGGDNDGSSIFSLEEKTTSNEESVPAEKININEAVSWLEARGLPVDRAKQVHSTVERVGGRKVNGFFHKNLIHLFENAEKGTEFHEAFHAVFRLYTDEANRKKLIKAAEQLYRPPSKSEINNLAKRYPNLSKEQVKELAYEEIMADKFKAYMLGDKTPKKKNTLWNRIKNFFQSILEYIGLYKNYRKQIDDYYKKIETTDFSKETKVLRSTPGDDVMYSLNDEFSPEESYRIGNILGQKFTSIYHKLKLESSLGGENVPVNTHRIVEKVKYEVSKNVYENLMFFNTSILDGYVHKDATEKYQKLNKALNNSIKLLPKNLTIVGNDGRVYDNAVDVIAENGGAAMLENSAKIASLLDRTLLNKIEETGNAEETLTMAEVLNVINGQVNAIKNQIKKQGNKTTSNTAVALVMLNAYPRMLVSGLATPIGMSQTAIEQHLREVLPVGKDTARIIDKLIRQIKETKRGLSVVNNWKSKNTTELTYGDKGFAALMVEAARRTGLKIRYSEDIEDVRSEDEKIYSKDFTENDPLDKLTGPTKVMLQAIPVRDANGNVRKLFGMDEYHSLERVKQAVNNALHLNKPLTNITQILTRLKSDENPIANDVYEKLKKIAASDNHEFHAIFENFMIFMNLNEYHFTGLEVDASTYFPDGQKVQFGQARKFSVNTNSLVKRLAAVWKQNATQPVSADELYKSNKGESSKVEIKRIYIKDRDTGDIHISFKRAKKAAEAAARIEAYGIIRGPKAKEGGVNIYSTLDGHLKTIRPVEEESAYFKKIYASQFTNNKFKYGANSASLESAAWKKNGAVYRVNDLIKDMIFLAESFGVDVTEEQMRQYLQRPAYVAGKKIGDKNKPAKLGREKIKLFLNGVTGKGKNVSYGLKKLSNIVYGQALNHRYVAEDMQISEQEMMHNKERSAFQQLTQSLKTIAPVLNPSFRDRMNKMRYSLNHGSTLTQINNVLMAYREITTEAGFQNAESPAFQYINAMQNDAGLTYNVGQRLFSSPLLRMYTNSNEGANARLERNNFFHDKSNYFNNAKDFREMNEIDELHFRLATFARGNSPASMGIIAPTLGSRGYNFAINFPRISFHSDMHQTQAYRENIGQMMKSILVRDLARMQAKYKRNEGLIKSGNIEGLIEGTDYVKNSDGTYSHGSYLGFTKATFLMATDKGKDLAGKLISRYVITEDGHLDFTLEENAEMFETYKEIYEEHFEQQTEALLKRMKKYKIAEIEYSERGDNIDETLNRPLPLYAYKGKDATLSGQKRLLAKDYVYANFIMQSSMREVFGGDLSLYGRGELGTFIKRTESLSTPGNTLISMNDFSDSRLSDTERAGTNLVSLDDFKSAMSESFKNRMSEYKPFFTTAILRDQFASDISLSHLNKVADAADNMGNSIAKKFANILREKYIKNPAVKTDAQAFVTMEYYRAMARQIKQWDENTHEKAYQNYLQGKKFAVYKINEKGEEEIEFVPILAPLKSFHDGIYSHENAGVTEAIRPLIKHSAIPLLKDFTEMVPELENLRQRMELEGIYANNPDLTRIDEVNFESGMKTSRMNIFEHENNVGRTEGMAEGAKINFSAMKRYPVRLSNSNKRFPQIIPTRKKNMKLGSQISKIIMDGYSENNWNEPAYLPDGTRITAKEILDKYTNALTAKITRNVRDFKGKLGLSPNDSFQDFDPATSRKFMVRMRNMLLNIAETRDLPENYRKILDIEEKNGRFYFKTPIHSPAFALKMQQVVLAMARKGMLQNFTPGKEFVQMAEFGDSLAVNDSLKYIGINEKTGELEPAEIAIPYDMAVELGIKFDEKGNVIEMSDKAKNLTRMMGYRIPTQERASLIPLKIAKVLPKSYGKVVMVPPEITTQMGSDFDIDKLYIMIPRVTKVVKTSTFAEESNKAWDYDGKSKGAIIKSMIQDEMENDVLVSMQEIIAGENIENEQKLQIVKEMKEAFSIVTPTMVDDYDLNKYNASEFIEYLYEESIVSESIIPIEVMESIVQNAIESYYSLVNEGLLKEGITSAETGIYGDPLTGEESSQVIDQTLFDAMYSMSVAPHVKASAVNPMDNKTLHALKEFSQKQVGTGQFQKDLWAYDHDAEENAANQNKEAGFLIGIYATASTGISGGQHVGLSVAEDMTGYASLSNVSLYVSAGVDASKDPLEHFVNDSSFNSNVTIGTIISGEAYSSLGDTLRSITSLKNGDALTGKSAEVAYVIRMQPLILLMEEYIRINELGYKVNMDPDVLVEYAMTALSKYSENADKKIDVDAISGARFNSMNTESVEARNEKLINQGAKLIGKELSEMSNEELEKQFDLLYKYVSAYHRGQEFKNISKYFLNNDVIKDKFKSASSLFDYYNNVGKVAQSSELNLEVGRPQMIKYIRDVLETRKEEIMDDYMSKEDGLKEFNKQLKSEGGFITQSLNEIFKRFPKQVDSYIERIKSGKLRVLKSTGEVVVSIETMSEHDDLLGKRKARQPYQHKIDEVIDGELMPLMAKLFPEANPKLMDLYGPVKENILFAKQMFIKPYVLANGANSPIKNMFTKESYDTLLNRTKPNGETNEKNIVNLMQRAKDFIRENNMTSLMRYQLFSVLEEKSKSRNIAFLEKTGIVMMNLGETSKPIKDKMTQEFQNLLESPHEELSDFAEALAQYAIINDGLQNSQTKFSDIVPADYYSYTTGYSKGGLKIALNEYMSGDYAQDMLEIAQENKAEFDEAFIRNHYDLNGLVRSSSTKRLIPVSKRAMAKEDIVFEGNNTENINSAELFQSMNDKVFVYNEEVTYYKKKRQNEAERSYEFGEQRAADGIAEKKIIKHENMFVLTPTESEKNHPPKFLRRFNKELGYHELLQRLPFRKEDANNEISRLYYSKYKIEFVTARNETAKTIIEPAALGANSKNMTIYSDNSMSKDAHANQKQC